jgi:hypothetical protein
MKTHSRRLYTAHVSCNLSSLPSAEFATIRECRQHAESYGSTADHCVIADRKNRIVGRHIRDKSGDGMRWYRATF